MHAVQATTTILNRYEKARSIVTGLCFMSAFFNAYDCLTFASVEL